MARLVTAILAKNEAARYLQRVLDRCISFSDTVLVLDDRSTDETPKLAQSMGCEVRGRSVLKGDAWGNEAPARQELWDWAIRSAHDGWVLFCDADMLLHGDPRPLLWTTEVNAWAFILYDVWDPAERVFRADEYWRGHTIPRPWMIRPEPTWSEIRPSTEGFPKWGRGIHSGHIHPAFPVHAAVADPARYYWLHLAYASPEGRKAKAQQYASVRQHLTPFEAAHAASILDYDAA